MSWFARLRRDQRRWWHWSGWLEIFGIGPLVEMLRGLYLIREPKSDRNDDDSDDE